MRAQTMTQQLGILLALVRKLCLRKLELRINGGGALGRMCKGLGAQSRALQPPPTTPAAPPATASDFTFRP